MSFTKQDPLAGVISIVVAGYATFLLVTFLLGIAIPLEDQLFWFLLAGAFTFIVAISVFLFLHWVRR